MTDEKYKPEELPSSITRKVYAHYFISTYRAGEIDILPFDGKYCNSDRIVLAELEITIPILEIDRDGLRSKGSDMLKAEKQKILAENEQRVQEVEDKIQMLLMITHQPISKNEMEIA